MRGLNTRVLLANARIMQLVDVKKALGMMDMVGKLAEKDGMTDAANGVHTMPTMFDDELLLASRWCAGQKRHEQGLDKDGWRKLCEQMATDANTGCGLSYDYFVGRLSAAVDRAMHDLADHERADALAIAVEFGYETVEQREQTAIDNANDGYCTHGIEMGCCPAGCDYPDDYIEVHDDPNEAEYLRMNYY
jgi:hypothetical protein